MKHTIHSALAAGVMALLSQAPILAADVPAGYVDFGKFAPETGGSQFVEVNVNSNLIAMVTKIASKSEPAVSDLLQGLKSIRVNVLGLNDENRDDIEKRIKDVRAQLDTQGWERVVLAQQKKQDVGVYLKTRGQDAVEGIVVTVLDGRKQAVLVNVVGNIKPEMLGIIGERFNIDPLKKVGHELEEKEAEKQAEKE